MDAYEVTQSNGCPYSYLSYPVLTDEDREMKEDEPSVLELLIRHELALKRLYEIFAAQFMSHQDFWQDIARDEQRHADRLATLRTESASCAELLRNSRFKPPAIKSAIGYIESQIVKTHKGNLTLLEALSIANDLENALLEKQFSKLSETGSQEIKSILSDITAETEKHRKLIVEAFNTEKRNI